LDARFLLAGFAVILLGAFLIPSARGLMILFAYLVFLHFLARLPARSLLSAARFLIPFLLLIVIINAFLVKGEPLVPGVSFVSREGVRSGVRGAARALVLYFAAATFLAAAGPEDVARGLSSFVRRFSPRAAAGGGMYAFLSFGFLPLFADEVQRIATAQKFRGGGMEGGLGGKLRGARSLVVPLVLSAVHRSDQLAGAVEIRRIRERIGGILVLEPAAPRDYVFLAATVTVAVFGLLV